MNILLGSILIMLILNLGFYIYKNFPNFFSKFKPDFLTLSITSIITFIILVSHYFSYYYKYKNYSINIGVTIFYFLGFNLLVLKKEKFRKNIFLAIFPFIAIWYKVFFENVENLLNFNYYDLKDMRAIFFEIFIFLIPTILIIYLCYKYRKNRMNFIGLSLVTTFLLFLLFLFGKRVSEYIYFEEIKNLSEKQKIIKVYEENRFKNPVSELDFYGISFYKKTEHLGGKNKILFSLISQIKGFETKKDYLIYLANVEENMSQDEITELLLNTLTESEYKKLEEYINIFMNELDNKYINFYQSRYPGLEFEDFINKIKEVYQKTVINYKILNESKHKNEILLAFKEKNREKRLMELGLDYKTQLLNLEPEIRNFFNYTMSFLEIKDKYLILSLDCLAEQKKNQDKFIVDFFIPENQKQDFLEFYELIHQNIPIKKEIAKKGYEDSTEGYYRFLGILKKTMLNNKGKYNDTNIRFGTSVFYNDSQNKKEKDFRKLIEKKYKLTSEEEKQLKEYMNSLDEKDEFWRKIKEINYKSYIIYGKQKEEIKKIVDDEADNIIEKRYKWLFDKDNGEKKLKKYKVTY